MTYQCIGFIATAIALRIIAGRCEANMDARIFYISTSDEVHHPFHTWKRYATLPLWLQSVARNYFPFLVDPWHRFLQTRTLCHQLAYVYVALGCIDLIGGSLPHALNLLEQTAPTAGQVAPISSLISLPINFTALIVGLLAIYHVPFSVSKILLLKHLKKNRSLMIDINHNKANPKWWVIAILASLFIPIIGVAYGGSTDSPEAILAFKIALFVWAFLIGLKWYLYIKAGK